jgi:hypothetical protein
MDRFSRRVDRFSVAVRRYIGPVPKRLVYYYYYYLLRNKELTGAYSLSNLSKNTKQLQRSRTTDPVVSVVDRLIFLLRNKEFTGAKSTPHKA